MSGNEAVVKICGRATFACGAEFKRLLDELRGRGWEAFTFDLSECPLMDSTFLGILAGFGMKADQAKTRRGTLLNANPKIVDLLDNLGVAHLFETRQGPSIPVSQYEPVAPSGAAPTQAEAARTALEAHQTLMDINPANVPKFRDVTRFLAEDLAKLNPPGRTGS